MIRLEYMMKTDLRVYRHPEYLSVVHLAYTCTRNL